MSKSKKKRDKAYRQKPCVKPLGIRDEAKLEMPALQALAALEQAHMSEQHIYDLLSPADLVKRIAALDDPIRLLAQECVHVVADIQRRSAGRAQPDISASEIATLRANIGKLVVFLRNAPNVAVWRAAKAAVDEFNRTGALRV